jgi:Tol biopolymer transport system component
MKPNLLSRSLGRLHGALWLNAALALGCTAGPLKLLSVIDSTQTPPAGGGGDSVAPLLSADGRYVIFASTAKNLATNNTANALSGNFPARFNTFRRDRTIGRTDLVSVSLAGDGGNEDSLPASISADGRFVLFESRASDLVPGDTNQASDIFVRDLSSNLTLLVSVGTNGAVGNGSSFSAALTPDGRFVAFVSTARNLVPGDTNGIADVFVRDLQSNITTLASVGAQGPPTGPAAVSETPRITPDGRYVAFYSTASNFVAGAGGSPNIYVRDRLSGATIWASIAASNAVNSVFLQTNPACFNHAISADGQFVSYEASPGPHSALNSAGLILRYSLQSGLTDLVHTNAAIQKAAFEDIRSLDFTPDGRFIAFVANTNSAGTTNTCILVWDAFSGATTLASGDLSNTVPANSICDWPTIDPTGRFVAFLSSATNLATNTLVGDFHLYRRDLQTGTTVLVDADTNAVGSILSPATIPQLSANGSLIAFEAADGNLVPNDRNHASDVFARDLSTGAIDMISARHPELPSLSPNAPSALLNAAASSDGRYVAFSSEADNLVPNDTNGFRDVFVRDTLDGKNFLVSIATNGTPADGASSEPATSADGRYVVFTSRADNLTAGDTNNTLDVFLRDRLNGTTTLVSVSTNSVAPGNDASYSPAVSGDGNFILFRSKAGNLAPGAFPAGVENLFLRNVQAAATYALTTGGVSASSTTADGRFVLFFGTASGSQTSLYLWDSLSNARVYTNTPLTAPGTVSVSPAGNRLAYAAGNQLRAIDRAANTNWVIGPAGGGSHIGMVFSADSRWLTYAAPPSLGGISQVYLYDFQTGTNRLLSQSFNAVDPGNDASDSPTISGDGRFVAYRSKAGNLVPNDANGVSDIFLYDLVSTNTTLLSASSFANRSADLFSLLPGFSGDGRTLLFQSWASDLVTGDANGSSDLFAYTLSNTPSLTAFFATVTADPGSPGAVWISWPALPGISYRVQFKNNLTDSQWQDAGGPVEIVGTQGFLRDAPAQNVKRFYRIIAF